MGVGDGSGVEVGSGVAVGSGVLVGSGVDVQVDVGTGSGVSLFCTVAICGLMVLQDDTKNNKIMTGKAIFCMAYPFANAHNLMSVPDYYSLRKRHRAFIFIEFLYDGIIHGRREGMNDQA